MVKAISPNSRCSCGSGKKYKNCHGMETGVAVAVKKFPLGYIVAIVIVVLVAVFTLYKTQTKPSGQVWSEEHGHFHDAP